MYGLYYTACCTKVKTSKKNLKRMRTSFYVFFVEYNEKSRVLIQPSQTNGLFKKNAVTAIYKAATAQAQPLFIFPYAPLSFIIIIINSFLLTYVYIVVV